MGSQPLEMAVSSLFPAVDRQKNQQPHFCKLLISRAENGTRTRDLNLGKVALYQLSYFRKMCDLLSEIAFAKIDKKNGFPNSERQKIRFFVILGCTSDVVCW